MDDLLPYFEDELAFLRDASRRFQERYPKLARQLVLDAESSGDPHVERLIQSVALLNARTRKRLEDSVPEVSETLLDVLYPYFLRPVPACSIAFVDMESTRKAGLTTFTRIPRGTAMKAAGAAYPCQFRTVFDMTAGPIELCTVEYQSLSNFSVGVTSRLDTESSIKVTIRSTSTVPLEKIPSRTLRLYLDGDATLCATLRDALFLNGVFAVVELDGSKRRHLSRYPVKPVGFDDGEALFPHRASEHAGHRLLVEYFAFPEKFNFVDLNLDEAITACLPGCRELTIQLVLRDIEPTSNTAATLQRLTPANMRLGCTPVINLFSHSASPILFSAHRSDYLLKPDELPPHAAEIYSVDSVKVLKGGAGGTRVLTFSPAYALRNSADGDEPRGYWMMHRPFSADDPSELPRISFLHHDLDTSGMAQASVSIGLTCTNRDLPAMLDVGSPHGDLSAHGLSLPGAVRLLRKPTRSGHLGRTRGQLWDLVAQLALNHTGFADDGALPTMLQLYCLPDAATARRQVGAIKTAVLRPTSAWVQRPHGGAYADGTEIAISLDERAFAGTSRHAFVQVLDHFFALGAHVTHFTQTVAYSSQTEREIIRCQPRVGLKPLL